MGSGFTSLWSFAKLAARPNGRPPLDVVLIVLAVAPPIAAAAIWREGPAWWLWGVTVGPLILSIIAGTKLQREKDALGDKAAWHKVLTTARDTGQDLQSRFTPGTTLPGRKRYEEECSRIRQWITDCYEGLQGCDPLHADEFGGPADLQAEEARFAGNSHGNIPVDGLNKYVQERMQRIQRLIDRGYSRSA